MLGFYRPNGVFNFRKKRFFRGFDLYLENCLDFKWVWLKFCDSVDWIWMRNLQIYSHERASRKFLFGKLINIMINTLHINLIRHINRWFGNNCNDKYLLRFTIYIPLIRFNINIVLFALWYYEIYKFSNEKFLGQFGLVNALICNKFPYLREKQLVNSIDFHGRFVCFETPVSDFNWFLSKTNSSQIFG